MVRYVSGRGQSLEAELDRLQRFADGPTLPFYLMEILYAAPARPVPGMVVYADGVTWNPGAGEGLYRYNLGGAWVLVG